MSDEEVIEVLARREGWSWNERHQTFDRYSVKDGWTHGAHVKELPYLTSRDALAPMLEGLSEEEWRKLYWLLTHHQDQPDVHLPVLFTQYLLTLPPRDLAHAIAEVLF